MFSCPDRVIHRRLHLEVRGKYSRAKVPALCGPDFDGTKPGEGRPAPAVASIGHRQSSIRVTVITGWCRAKDHSAQKRVAGPRTNASQSQ